MDLVIAIAQRTTIVDVRCQPTDGRRRQRPDQVSSRIGLQACYEGAVVRSEALTEGSRDRAEVGLPIDRYTRPPRLEAIDVRWFN